MPKEIKVNSDLFLTKFEKLLIRYVLVTGLDLPILPSLFRRRSIAENAHYKAMPEEYIQPACTMRKRAEKVGTLLSVSEEKEKLIENEMKKCIHKESDESVCGAFFAQTSSLVLHVFLHHNGFMCDFCGETYSNIYDLENHSHTTPTHMTNCKLEEN